MNEEQARSIRTRLTAAAEQISAQPGGEKGLYLCMLYLSRAVEQLKADPAALNENDFRVVLQANREMGGMIANFARKAQARPITEEQQSAVEQLRQEIDQLNQQLAAGRLEIDQLNQQRAKADADLTVQRSVNKRLQASLETAQGEMEHARQVGFQLLEDLKAVSQEKIDQQNQKNDQLADQITAGRETLGRLESTTRELEDELGQVNERIAGLEEQVQALPQEMRDREAAYTELEKQFTRIQHAEEECSDEKRQALEEEIAQLQPRVEALKAEYEAVQREHGSVTTAYQSLQADTAEAEETLLNALGTAVSALEAHSQSLAGRLRAAMERCRTFEDNLQLCRDHYALYHAWMGSLVPVVEAMSRKAGLGPQEYENLYATMDPGQCETIRQLMEQTEEGLRRLDGILSEGMRAARIDQIVTQRRAEEGEAAASRARREMQA